MAVSDLPSFTSVVPLFLIFSVLWIVRPARKHAPYPPGPRPLPLIGNALDLQMDKGLAEDYTEWGKKYNSDLLFATTFGTHVLIINSQEDADELFEKRAKIYSDRPQFTITRMIGWDRLMPLMPYGSYWRLCRKICQRNFNNEAAKKYLPVIQEKVSIMLSGLLDSPHKLAHHNKMLTTSITMATMYGYEVTSLDDPMIAAADKNIRMGGNLLEPRAGPFLLNVFPFLEYIPPRFAGPFKSRKIVEETLALSRYIQTSLHHFITERMSNGTAVSSLVTDFMQQNPSASEEDAQAIKDVALTVYNAAGDTTISVTSTFFYLMAKYPEIQEKAQREIDRVIGRSRIPDFGDRPSLPYIEAIYREVMRWQQSLQLGVPRALSEDDYYKGYFIPKGTIAIGNIWAMTHDERVYPDPHTFKPERFFDTDGNLNQDSRILAYGFGRRVCAGKYVASSVVWLMMVSVLACFHIGKDKDKFGNEIELNDEYVSKGFLTHKKDYRCSIIPRTSAYIDLVKGKI